MRSRTVSGTLMAMVTLAFVTALSLGSTAHARETSISVKTPLGPCAPQVPQDACNRVQVRQIGPATAKKVLVLIPGTQGGAGDFTLMARDLVRRIPGLQVWSVDRRTQILEDTSVFKQTLATAKKSPAIRKRALAKAFCYYLDFFDASCAHVTLRDEAADGAWADDLGAAVALNDVHAVVKLARAQKRKVVLGGHSLGGGLATQYAAWDFEGTPGYSFIDGLVLIDGGGKSANDAATSQAAVCSLNGQTPTDSTNPSTTCEGVASPLTAKPWLSLLPGLPAASAGLFAEVGALYAKLDPLGSAEKIRTFSLLPASFNPGFKVTNRGLLGYAFDRDTAPEGLALLQVNAGRLKPGCGAGAAKPCDWVDGGVTPISRVANTFGQEPANAVEWYFPRRLSVDSGYGSSLTQTSAADGEAEDQLGLRVYHGADIDVPVYAIRTDLGVTPGDLSAVQRLLTHAGIPSSKATLVNASTAALGAAKGQSHLDPLLGSPTKNKLFPTLIPFLKNKAFK